MKKIIILITLSFIISCTSKTTEKEDINAIKNVLKQQEKAWTNNNIEGYMQGYWKSDSLKFYGSGGLTKGWQQTLVNYKKRYPTKEHFGKLIFKTTDISKIENNSYWVMGTYHLKRKIGNANGFFMIIFKKINGEWKIISDTTC